MCLKVQRKLFKKRKVKLENLKEVKTINRIGADKFIKEQTRNEKNEQQ